MFPLFLLTYSVGISALLALQFVLGTNLPLEDLERLVRSSDAISSPPSDAIEALRRNSVPRNSGLFDDSNIASALMNGLRYGKEQFDADAVALRQSTSSATLSSDTTAHTPFASVVSSDSEDTRPEKRLKGPLVPTNPTVFLDIPKLSLAQRRVSLEELREHVYIQLGSRPRVAKSTDPLVVPYDDHLTVKDYGIFIAELANRPPWIYSTLPPAPKTQFLIRQASHKHDSFQSINGFKSSGRNVRYFEAWQGLGKIDSGLLFDFLGVFRVPQESSSRLKAEVLRESVFPLKQYVVLSPSAFAAREIHKLRTPIR
ncbi:hypothetical protein PHSY_006364 [Pseudozyma hubeiensis SY62]|uniref:Uncharacterized protein n=1 Tax=Pseudozyma hubeiensis (strain SY62) TaxID=1305764 RepID=R9PBP6_PSEHS|nr:hypothetical protein PHSY_006364 [Pseudozyma hubeiensis SY62]GAC98769.1 hypothetical protein PHSY_006364 [Pseudozyma hubeiensis SY62]